MDQQVHQVISGAGVEAQVATAAVLSALRQGPLGVLALVSAEPELVTAPGWFVFGGESAEHQGNRSWPVECRWGMCSDNTLLSNMQQARLQPCTAIQRALYL
jgi:hypothetical protein